MPLILANTSTVTKTSTCHKFKLVSTLLKACGAEINLMSLSISSIHHQGTSTITSSATVVQEKINSFEFAAMENMFLILYWNGKMIQYITRDTKDWFVIAISAPNFISRQFLASPAIVDDKGLTMAVFVMLSVSMDSILKLKQWTLILQQAIQETGSNTGKWDQV